MSRPGRRTDVALLVFVGVVVLAVVGSLVVVGVARSTAEKPADVARGYLEALAAADATKALSYASSAPVDQTLLTDAVLTSSQRRAPLTDIAVSVDSASDEAVDVTYRLGDTPVSDHYTLTRVAGAWKLDEVSVAVSFPPLFDARLPVVVNGTTVDVGGSEAFPVSYAVTTGLPDVDWGERSTTTVALDRSGTDLALQPRLTRAGKQVFVSGAKKLVSACVAERKLQPDECPFGFRQPTSGPRIPDSSVRWRLKGSPWGDLSPELDSATNPGVAKARTSMTFVCTCRFTTGEACKAQDVTNEVIFAGDVTEDPMKVTFAAY